MQHIKQKYNQAIYGYTPGEFLPVWEGGELRNRNQFIIYKIRKIFTK